MNTSFMIELVSWDFKVRKDMHQIFYEESMLISEVETRAKKILKDKQAQYAEAEQELLKCTNRARLSRAKSILRSRPLRVHVYRLKLESTTFGHPNTPEGHANARKR